ncbi:unnamed protein product [Caenorhabditis angaria]|uniref:C2H2-type domain-containing protein n=1 Tax=Caenorhabditis angaria TaxID=860376 RepID=A0A9P1I3B5_9PELO|nr:unnamed protein product [Caenorhabditis angaria]
MASHETYVEYVEITEEQMAEELRQYQQNMPNVSYQPAVYYEEIEVQQNSSSFLFQCSICPKAYTTMKRLRHHEQFHENREAFKCEFCCYCYQSPDTLQRHIKRSEDCKKYYDSIKK